MSLPCQLTCWATPISTKYYCGSCLLCCSSLELIKPQLTPLLPEHLYRHSARTPEPTCCSSLWQSKCAGLFIQSSQNPLGHHVAIQNPLGHHVAIQVFRTFFSMLLEYHSCWSTTFVWTKCNNPLTQQYNVLFWSHLCLVYHFSSYWSP
jgi:hypothetical protein